MVVLAVYLYDFNRYQEAEKQDNPYIVMAEQIHPFTRTEFIVRM